MKAAVLIALFFVVATTSVGIRAIRDRTIFDRAVTFDIDGNLRRSTKDEISPLVAWRAIANTVLAAIAAVIILPVIMRTLKVHARPLVFTMSALLGILTGYLLSPIAHQLLVGGGFLFP